jgi:hypothetical protein
MWRRDGTRWSRVKTATVVSRNTRKHSMVKEPIMGWFPNMRHPSCGQSKRWNVVTTWTTSFRPWTLSVPNRKLMCYRREFTEVYHIFQSSSFFYGALSTSVFTPEGKYRALIYLHTFTFILLAIVYPSYLSFQKVFFALNNYLHLKMARYNTRQYILFGYQYLILGDCCHKRIWIAFLQTGLPSKCFLFKSVLLHLV